MGLQQELGRQTPMRPTTMTYDLLSGGAFALIDQSGGVDWTAATTRVPLEEKTKTMDDFSRFSTPGVANVVREGIYELEFTATVQNASVAVEDFRMAITDAAGTTVHVQTADITVPASGSMTASVRVMLHLNTKGANTFCFRAAQRTAGTDITIAPEYLGYIRKIGNYNET